jgi:hypothetical protein
MSTHIFHPDTHEHGLASDCPRCIEHAEHPERGLDSDNLERLRQGRIFTPLDKIAAIHLSEVDQRQLADQDEIDSHRSSWGSIL